MCSLPITELIPQEVRVDGHTVFSYDRMCSLTIECVLLLQEVQSGQLNEALESYEKVC